MGRLRRVAGCQPMAEEPSVDVGDQCAVMGGKRPQRVVELGEEVEGIRPGREA